MLTSTITLFLGTVGMAFSANPRSLVTREEQGVKCICSQHGWPGADHDTIIKLANAVRLGFVPNEDGLVVVKKQTSFEFGCLNESTLELWNDDTKERKVDVKEIARYAEEIAQACDYGGTGKVCGQKFGPDQSYNVVVRGKVCGMRPG